MEIQTPRTVRITQEVATALFSPVTGATAAITEMPLHHRMARAEGQARADMKARFAATERILAQHAAVLTALALADETYGATQFRSASAARAGLSAVRATQEAIVAAYRVQLADALSRRRGSI